ncbi:MAG: reverse transcriptase domain-containing protein [Candidatus Anammoxibacter sp.]
MNNIKPYSSLIKKVASNTVVDQAYAWLCARRKGYSHNDDVWDICFRWNEIKPWLQKALISGKYTFSSQKEILLPDRRIELWSAMDSLVLKAMSIVLGEYLGPVLSNNCYHLKGHGGAKAAVMATFNHLKQDQHVMKSDVKCYYASIDHEILFGLLQEHVKDECVLNLLSQYMKRTIYSDGFYRDIKQGISLGCPLSPLMSALYLKPLDDCMAKTGLFYARFMDDWVVIAPTRWKLRKAVSIVNKTLDMLRVEQAPDKTFIGRVDSGFDFLGYYMEPESLHVAKRTIGRFAERISRLYEHGAGIKRIGEYMKHWLKWVGSVGLLRHWVHLEAKVRRE